MRCFIIDTDTGSDDAIAVMMMLLSDDVQVEAVTTVRGNIGLEQATLNALATIEVVGKGNPPVYKGSYKPLIRELVTAEKVHGEDGMGDCGLIHPKGQPQKGHAVDVICRLVAQYPDEIEILTIGPATNLALAIMKEPELMRKTKHIYSMGTGGFGPGNATPVAEFNVYVDAEAYNVMLCSGIPITIAGFDLCLGKAALNEGDIARLKTNGTAAGKFAIECNKTLLEYNIWRSGEHIIDLPDPVAAAIALWDDIVLDAWDCYCYTCTKEEPAYGQVIPFSPKARDATEGPYVNLPPNARVVREIDYTLFKKRLIDMLT